MIQVRGFEQNLLSCRRKEFVRCLKQVIEPLSNPPVQSLKPEWEKNDVECSYQRKLVTLLPATDDFYAGFKILDSTGCYQYSRQVFPASVFT